MWIYPFEIVRELPVVISDLWQKNKLEKGTFLIQKFFFRTELDRSETIFMNFPFCNMMFKCFKCQESSPAEIGLVYAENWEGWIEGEFKTSWKRMFYAMLLMFLLSLVKIHGSFHSFALIIACITVATNFFLFATQQIQRLVRYWRNLWVLDMGTVYGVWLKKFEPLVF